MTLIERYEAMKRFVAGEKPYVERIALLERHGGGTHPLYGNDESAALASEAFTSMNAFLIRRPPKESESLDDYSGLMAEAMGELEWRQLWRFERLRDAWTMEDFSLGEERYDAYGVKTPEKWGFEIPREGIPSIVAAIVEKATRSFGATEGIEEARAIAGDFAALFEDRDAGLIWAQFHARERMADKDLGAAYRFGSGRGGSWNPPSNYGEMKGRAKAYGAALDILEPLFRKMSGGKRP